MAEAAVLPLSSEAAGVISIARNILPRPTPSAPRRALLPGDHSFIFKGGLVDPRLRASNEHIPIVRVPRAGGRPGYPSHPSETARCTSTGGHPVCPLLPFPISLAFLFWKDTHVGRSAAVERGPSQDARSGSTGPIWVSFHPLFN